MLSEIYATNTTPESGFLFGGGLIGSCEPMQMITKTEYEDYQRLKKNHFLGITKVVFNDPVTVILWADGTKTIVRNMDGTEFNPYHGFCAAVTKKIIGENHNHKVKKIINERSNLDYDRWEYNRKVEREAAKRAESTPTPKESLSHDVLRECAKLFGEIVLDAIGGGLE